MKEKFLSIYIRGEWYMIDENGYIFGGPNNIRQPSRNWRFLGVSTHHWHNRIIYTFKDIWENPDLAIHGYLWDEDHGTTRIWGGKYDGHLPRIVRCFHYE